MRWHVCPPWCWTSTRGRTTRPSRKHSRASQSVRRARARRSAGSRPHDVAHRGGTAPGAARDRARSGPRGAHRRGGRRHRWSDVVVVSQKAVSKAEDRLVRLADVAVSPRAHELADSLRKEPEMVQLIIDESAEILRA